MINISVTSGFAGMFRIVTLTMLIKCAFNISIMGMRKGDT
jgi:hypothetical protein